MSGRIARLVLIQLQFVKKELLVAMQAIDELFNANQVNLQLLAVTPAILAVLSLQIISRSVVSIIRSTSRGKIVDSVAMVHKELRDNMRELERLLVMASQSESWYPEVGDEGSIGERRLYLRRDMDSKTLGKMMSILYRLQIILVVNASQFDYAILKQLQVSPSYIYICTCLWKCMGITITLIV